jgi:hypothetical protein
MTSRAAWLVVGLAGLAGCDDWIPYYPYRVPCEEDAAPGTCCPLGSHQVVGMHDVAIICAPDEVPCADAGACSDAGTDAP